MNNSNDILMSQIEIVIAIGSEIQSRRRRRKNIQVAQHFACAVYNNRMTHMLNGGIIENYVHTMYIIYIIYIYRSNALQ